VARRVSSPRFIGREPELAELLSALAAADGATPTAVLLSGESGIGKTRLVAEFVALARDAGARVLQGGCLDLGDGELPYAPIIGALRGVQERDDAALDALLGGGDAPAVAQPRLFEALLALLRRLGEASPVVLVVEDLQWADRSTRDLLAFLVRNARTERLVLVATYRSDELHRRHPLRPFLTELGRAPSVTRLEVPPFTRDELAAQAEAILGDPPDAALVDELYARGEGNAFFTEELVAARDFGLPDSLRDALMLRVDTLSVDAQEVLRVAAVAGREVDHRLLTLTAGLPEDELVDALREAVARNILVHDARAGTYGFRHALLREALEDDLLTGERAPLHARIAQALEADPSLSISGVPTAAELAFHWAMAHDAPRAYAASVRAADEARRVSAYAEAHAHDERALEFQARILGEPVDVDFLRRAADTAQQAGDLPRAITLARQAIALTDDPVLQAGLHARLGRALWLSGDADLAQETLERGVALLPADAPAEVRARVLGALGHVLLLRLRNDQAVSLLREALGHAEAAGAPLEHARILISLGAAATETVDHAESNRLLLEGRRIAAEIGALDEVLRSHVNRSENLDRHGLLDEAIADSLEGWRLAEREGMAIEASLLASEAMLRLMRVGRWDEAAAVLAEAEPRVSGGMAGGALLQAGAELSALRGETAAAARRAERAARLLAGAIGPMWAAPVAVMLANVALWDGRPAEAAEIAAGALETLGQETDPAAAPYLAPLVAIGAQAEADVAERARALGERTQEAAARERLQALVDRLARFTGDPSPEVRAYVAMGSAETRREDADAWGAVAQAWEALPRPFPAAYARWREAAAALEGGGGRARAEAPLRVAAATARALGAAPLLGEATALARRARIALDGAGEPAPVTGETPAARVGLTPRELEVLRLVAEGRTNREIGETLFMSEKTASVHVSRILAKLDARSRVEAGTLAQRLGLLDAEPETSS
jgi:DNA-binding CsgD family transcriptional regulator/tetratricopeptide (TPR) repeat protein